ncbi:MAG: DNA-3-methyladenine glycosylase I [Coxiella sp. (in: Bacteria)]|nr:MAG: DNA-3-methyladenine glycosylase I [Coxiella sp. (in: g-proteobacteria)]
METQKTRCGWVNTDPLYVDYHDQEWGKPIYDDQLLFEFLILEGAQAGLSWWTVLKKRAHYRDVFANFDPHKIARFTDRRVEKLLQDPGIIRNRLKVNAAITNAKAYLKVCDEFDSFSAYIWSFVDGKPVKNHWKTLAEVPVTTPASDAMAKDLKKRGFKFVGTTICYAYMQAVGMVDDHLTTCFIHVGSDQT